MIDSVNRLLTQGMIPLIGPSQFRVVSSPSALRSAGSDGVDDLVEDPQGLAPPLPLGLAPEQVLLRHHVQDRPHVLGHPAVDEDQALGQGLMEPGGAAFEDLVAGQEPTSADPGLGVPLDAGDPSDDLHAREDAARILPAAARAPEPLAEDRPGHDHRRLLGVEHPRQVLGLAGRPHQARDHRGQQVGRDRQPRPLGDVVDLADNLQPMTRPDDRREQLVEPAEVPSREGGTSPEAITPALMRPR